MSRQAAARTRERVKIRQGCSKEMEKTKDQTQQGPKREQQIKKAEKTQEHTM